MDARSSSLIPSHIGSSQQKSTTTDRDVSISNSASPRLPLWCRFFGRFEVFCGNEVIALPKSTKTLRILKYLLASPERSVPRDFLMDWLWPESDFVRARYSVNTVVCSLRKLFSSLSPTLAPLDCILLEQDHYRLSPNICVVSDKDEFDARYKRGCQLERDQWVSEAITEYDGATALYKGEFLSEDLYEEWTLIERQRLDSAYIYMLERIATYHRINSTFRESMEACYRILAKYPCQESSHRLLMECYFELGLRAQALRQYKLCEKILRRRYSVAPSSQTKTLYRQLRERTADAQ